MEGGQQNFVKENGGAGRLATPQEMADPLLFLNSDIAAFVSGLHRRITRCRLHHAF